MLEGVQSKNPLVALCLPKQGKEFQQCHKEMKLMHILPRGNLASIYDYFLKSFYSLWANFL